MRQVNEAGLALIKEFEGCKLTAYKDAVGIWTIGWGTTAAAGVGIKPEAGMTITQAEADWYLEKTVAKFAEGVSAALRNNVTDNQFAACVSLAYNIGVPRFAASSVVKWINAGDFEGAANSFLLWNKAGGKVLKGLVRRREAERALFLTPQRVIKAPAQPDPQEAPIPASGSIFALIARFFEWLAKMAAKK